MEWFVGLTFVLSFLASILSGMGGGGGGFVMIPYFLFIGLPPANAIATMKLVGVGTAFGSLTAFKGKGLVHKKLVVPFMGITLVCALLAAWLIPHIDSLIFKKLIGLILVLLAPTMFIKKAAFQPGPRSLGWIVVGFIAYTAFTFLLALVGSGVGSVLVLILMFLFGLSALESQATKRVAATIQVAVLLVLLSVQGLVVWVHGIVGLAGSLLGSHIGTHIAIKKGDRFIKIMMAVVMVISGFALLL